MKAYEALVVGASAGGFHTVPEVLSKLPASFPLAVIVVQHVAPQSDGHFYVDYLSGQLDISVCEARERESVRAGFVHLAPANYHLLIEPDRRFSLSVGPRVNYSRPAIDVLFMSAARVYGPKLAGVVLSGANSDGARGLAYIQSRGGLAIVQDPQSAVSPPMPEAALRACRADYVLPPDKMAGLLPEILTPEANK